MAAGKLKWWEAAEILGITDRQLRRMRQRYEEHGYDGLYDYRKRRPSPKRAPMKTVEQVLHLYRERYYDFNVRHFHEKLASGGARHRFKLHVGEVATAGCGAGEAAAPARSASQASAPSAHAGDAVAHRCQPACLVSGRALV